MEGRDPIADLEQAFGEAEQKEIVVALEMFAQRLYSYHSALVALGFDFELADDLVKAYHERVLSPRVSVLGV